MDTNFASYSIQAGAYNNQFQRTSEMATEYIGRHPSQVSRPPEHMLLTTNRQIGTGVVDAGVVGVFTYTVLAGQAKRITQAGFEGSSNNTNPVSLLLGLSEHNGVIAGNTLAAPMATLVNSSPATGTAYSISTQVLSVDLPVLGFDQKYAITCGVASSGNGIRIRRDYNGVDNGYAGRGDTTYLDGGPLTSPFNNSVSLGKIAPVIWFTVEDIPVTPPTFSGVYTNQNSAKDVPIGTTVDLTTPWTGATSYVVTNLPTGLDATAGVIDTSDVPTADESRLVKVVASNAAGNSIPQYFVWKTGTGGNSLIGAGSSQSISPVGGSPIH